MGRFQDLKSRLATKLADLERRHLAFAILIDAARDFNRHHCTQLAASIAYYSIFSLFPLLLALITLASFLFQEPDVQANLISAASKLLPGSGQLVQRSMREILAARGTVGTLAMITLLWSAKAVFGAITTSLNLAWGVAERRPFWKLTAMQLALVIGTGFFIATSIAITYALAIISDLPIPLFGSRLQDTYFGTLFTVPFSLAFNTLSFLLLYRYLPCTSLSFGDVWPGALLAGILFEIAKNAYVLYTTDFSNFRLVYGSLAVVIILLFWAWISGAILLLGAEVSEEYSKRRRLRQFRSR